MEKCSLMPPINESLGEDASNRGNCSKKMVTNHCAHRVVAVAGLARWGCLSGRSV